MTMLAHWHDRAPVAAIAPTAQGDGQAVDSGRRPDRRKCLRCISQRAITEPGAHPGWPGTLLLLKRLGRVIRGHRPGAALGAYGPVRFPRPEHASDLQVQLVWVGHVPDLAERLTPPGGGDDERPVPEQPAQGCALQRQAR